MSEQNERPTLESLQREIDAAKRKSTLAPAPEENADGGSGKNGLGNALQLASGIAAGSAVGIGCGYFIDRWLGSSPIALVVCFFLGFAGGVYHLIRGTEK